ncbi:MAG: VWA domain-containing protein [Alphaproteobacteria bacterium]|nr:VWA domain-containing protein [Alphaproteobacteria bacterium]
MSFFENFHFLRPLWLLTLLPLLFLGRGLWNGLKNTSAWETVCDKNLLDFLIVKGSSRQRRVIRYLALIGLLSGIIALSGPTWRKKQMPVFSPANPVMLLLNLSSDMEGTDITPNRLSRAKFAIDDLLKNLKAQVGLIVYTSEPYLITPITDDTKIISNLLPAISRDIVPENGDRLNRAIDLAVESLQAGHYNYGNIVVFAADIGQELNATLSSATKSHDDGYKINVVDVTAGNNEKLRMLASKGDGTYLNISSNINVLAEQINSHINSELQKTKNQQEIWEDSGYWFLLISMLCFIYFFRRGVLVILLFLSISGNSHAGFFTNANQDAARAFAAGDYATAANKFSVTDWKAAASYRNRDYHAAESLYRQGEGIENMYNLGNALAKSGKIEDAIKQYEEVLKINPEHEDAKFNLEYLKQQQNNNSQQNNQNEQGQNGADDQQQGQSGEQSSSENQQDQNDTSNPEDNDNKESSSASSEQNSDQNQNDDSSPEQDGQNFQNSPSDNNEKDEKSSAEQFVPAGGTPDEKTNDDPAAATSKTSNEKGKFDEEAQAREMSYRNIPENPGGLLRAFIYKEYSKNRYGDK